MAEDRKTNGAFEQVAVELLKDTALTDSELVYYILIIRLSHKEGYCYISSRELGKLRGKGMRTAQRVVESLKKKGYIKAVVYTDERGKSHRRIFPVRYVKSGMGVKIDIGSYDKSDVGGTSNLSPTYVKSGTQIILKNNTKMNKSANAHLRKRASSQQDKRETMFNEFWQAYPKKRDKARARKSFFKIKNLPDVFPHLMKGLEQQKASADWKKDGGKYIPLPSTWLNNERWEDELPTQVQPPAQGPIRLTQADMERMDAEQRKQIDDATARYRQKKLAEMQKGATTP